MSLFDQLENKQPNRKKAPPKEKIYNAAIWSDLDMDEKQAYKIYEAFQKMTNKRGLKQQWLPNIYSKIQLDPEEYPNPGDYVRNAKNWKYFYETWMIYKDINAFDPYNFIEACYRTTNKNEKIYPAQLKTKKYQEQYKAYIEKLQNISNVETSKVIMQDIANSYKFIKNRIDYCDFGSIWHWFHDIEDGDYLSDGVVCAVNELLSIYYLTISKSFIKVYFTLDKDIQEEIINLQKFKHTQLLVKNNKEVYSFAKELFGDDII
jgi:hypothetical protein